MRRGGISACLFYLAVLAFGSTAWARTSIIPLPAVGVSRNDGVEVGNLTAFLISDDAGVVHAILAPSATYNSVIHLNVVFRLFWYGTGDRDLSLIIGHSTGKDQEYTVTFRDPFVWKNRLSLDGRISFERDSRSRFFGLGPYSPSTNETNYTQNEFEGFGAVAWNLTRAFRLSVGQHIQVFGVNEGSVDTLPFIGALFPQAPGITGATILGHRFSAVADTRDDQTTPTRGRYGEAFIEFLNAFEDERSIPFIRGGVEGSVLLPSSNKRLTTVAHVRVEFGTRGDAPIFAQGHLGGDATLRGFGDDRFIDRHLFLVNIEERIKVLEIPLFGVVTEWEVDPFIDAGKVFHRIHALLDRVQVNPGVGFRALVRPNVVGRVDLAAGRDGLATFVGIDFPF